MNPDIIAETPVEMEEVSFIKRIQGGLHSIVKRHLKSALLLVAIYALIINQVQRDKKSKVLPGADVMNNAYHWQNVAIGHLFFK